MERVGLLEGVMNQESTPIPESKSRILGLDYLTFTSFY